MILVDSSAWINYFNSSHSEVDDKIKSIILGGNEACLSGIILQEVLQGVRDDTEYALLKERFGALPFVQTGRSTYLLASEIYRTAKKKGVTIPSTDALIAATAIENKLSLLTLDGHFLSISKVFKELKLI